MDDFGKLFRISIVAKTSHLQRFQFNPDSGSNPGCGNTSGQLSQDAMRGLQEYGQPHVCCSVVHPSSQRHQRKLMHLPSVSFKSLI
jgi:hypothetical protein